MDDFKNELQNLSVDEFVEGEVTPWEYEILDNPLVQQCARQCFNCPRCFNCTRCFNCVRCFNCARCANCARCFNCARCGPCGNCRG